MGSIKELEMRVSALKQEIQIRDRTIKKLDNTLNEREEYIKKLERDVSISGKRCERDVKEM